MSLLNASCEFSYFSSFSLVSLTLLTSDIWTSPVGSLVISAVSGPLTAELNTSIQHYLAVVCQHSFVFQIFFIFILFLLPSSLGLSFTVSRKYYLPVTSSLSPLVYFCCNGNDRHGGGREISRESSCSGWDLESFFGFHQAPICCLCNRLCLKNSSP